MNENIMNICGIDCYEKDGVAYLRLETAARGLGFTRIADSGNEVIRWDRVRKHLDELGVPTCGHGDEEPTGKEGLPEFIPENIFYRLAMKAKNETAENFQALIADKVIPEIRKHGTYSVPDKVFPPEVSLSGLADYLRITRRISLDAGVTPQEILKMSREILETLNVPVPQAWRQTPEFQISFSMLPALE